VQANDGMGTLGRFCSWTGREKMNLYGKEQFDVAIYLTRKELGSAGRLTFSLTLGVMSLHTTRYTSSIVSQVPKTSCL